MHFEPETRKRAGRSGPSRWLRRLLLPLASVAVVALTLTQFLSTQPVRRAAPVALTPTPTTVREAVAVYERAVAERPADLAALQRLGVTYVERAAAFGDLPSYDRARQVFDRADAIAPGDLGTLVGRGRLALSLRDFPLAHELGERALAARPRHPGALDVLVDAKLQLGRYAEAIDTLERRLALRTDIRALQRAATVRELTGDLDGAAAALRQAETVGSPSALDQALVANGAGRVALRGGQLDAAARYFSRAEALEPGLPATAAGLARVRVAQGDLDGALRLLDRGNAWQAAPRVAVLHADLLRAAGRERQAEQADATVRALTQQAGSAGQITDLELARFEADRGEDPALALRLASAAFRARPDNVFAADALAWALHRAGDTAAAVPLVERALTLGGADAGMRIRAATVLEAAGQPQRAGSELAMALAESPATAIAERSRARDLAARLDLPVPKAWATG